jgi:hypothetical protein
MDHPHQGGLEKGYGVDVLKIQMIQSISLRTRFREIPMIMQN